MLNLGEKMMAEALNNTDTLANTTRETGDGIQLFPREYRDLDWVPRWGIARVIRRQTVAAHSYFVSLYADILARELGLSAEDHLSLVTSALYHDIEECYTSDNPGPVKHATVDKVKYDGYIKVNNERRFGATPECPPHLKVVLKIADLFEETVYLFGEMQQGNLAVKHMAEASKHRLMAKVSELNVSDSVKSSLSQKLLDSLYCELNTTSKGVVDVSTVAS